MTLERVEKIISYVLRLGVGLSLLVIVAGTVISFAHHPGYFSSTDLASLTSPDGAIPSLHAVITGVLAGQGQAIVMLGLLLLIATPVVRVAVSIVVFLMQRDMVFVAITTAVLAALLFSFWIGKAE
jgi:uncharacterized membrane protein